MAHFRITNWQDFQHYKDRNPPWIKLHRELLASRTWVTLDDAGRALAIACMLLAAATGNEIPDDPAYVRRVAYLNSDPDFAPLVRVGFLEHQGDAAGAVNNASTPQADATAPQADARPEGEAEERQSREEQKAARYAFEGVVIRLTQPDLDKLIAAFHAIPDMVAELTAIDAKFVADPPDKWWGRLNGWLKAEHNKRLAEAKSKPTTSPYRLPEVRSNRVQF